MARRVALSAHSTARRPLDLRRGLRVIASVIAASGIAACARPAAPGPPGRCVLRIATSGDYAPFSLRSTDGLSGLDVDLARRLGSDLDCEIEWVVFRWPELLGILDRQEADIAFGGITMRPERALHGLFSRPYARTGVVVVAAPSSGLRTLGDCREPGARIAVNRGGHLERWTRHHLAGATIESVTDNQSLPALLRAGRVDAIVTDTAEVATWSLAARRLGPFTTDYKAILVGPERNGLAARIDRWLVDRESDGSLAAARSGSLDDPQTESSAAATMQAIAALVRLRLDLMPLVAGAKASTGKRVTDAGQEARVIERARSWSARPSERIDGVFGALIELAKQVQRDAGGRDGAASLQDLRIAIAGVDRQIVRELDRLPDATAPRWREVLSPVLEHLPLEKRDLDPLVRVLAASVASAPAP
jgi:ABC-type amino acid transport substrate-binding protein